MLAGLKSHHSGALLVLFWYRVTECTRLGRKNTMSLSLVQSRALLGLEAAAVTVEVHLANGLPSFTLVGLVDVEVKEARVCATIDRELWLVMNQ